LIRCGAVRNVNGLPCLVVGLFYLIELFSYVVGANCMCVLAISICCGPLLTRWSSFDTLWGSFYMFWSSFDTLWGSWCRALLIRCGALFTYNWALMIRCGAFVLLNRCRDTLWGSFHMFLGSLDTLWGSSLVVELFYTLWSSLYV